MRILRYLVLGALLLAFLTVALANRGPVGITLLPEDLAMLLGWQARAEVPVFVVLGFGAVMGIVIGFVWEWLREHKHRKVARVQTRAVTKLERELAAMKDQTSLPQDDVLALLQKPRK
ncbi:LapA family protein [Rhodobacter sp. KR11]|uniref:LapA family protein n=1 Tax=Rhodobacter sp. KR11 TaxID=2974588 RepID=UPI002223E688|nr:LapA family protein [Rhodobacter sp. KR11]MCW1918435.1 LapA family protein [Rhodobacter sp. KR11]